MNHSSGMTLVFNCQAFGTSRSGAMVGEMVLIQHHEHSIDIRYAAHVMFEYIKNGDKIWVRANAREANLPTVPIEWKNWVLQQNHMLPEFGK